MGRILMIEFSKQDAYVLDEIMEVLKQYPDFQHFNMNEETVISLPGLKIHFGCRKIYCNNKEVDLTTKEFDILCLLASNKGRVFTYEQIYEKLWDEEALGNVNNTVGCHIRSLRRKLNRALQDSSFVIRCIRDVGYCFEVNK